MKNKTGNVKYTKAYRVWDSMKQRCYNPNDDKYKNYGARGIKVCDEWLHDSKAFMKWAYENGFDETKSQKEQSIDRIDVNGNYEPSNCRFTNARVQANNKTNNVLITFNGKTQTLAEWSRETGIQEGTIRFRMKSGWSVRDALTTPVQKQKKREKNYQIEYKGKSHTMTEWANIIGCRVATLRRRLYSGWSIERALETPIGADKWHRTQEINKAV